MPSVSKILSCTSQLDFHVVTTTIAKGEIATWQASTTLYKHEVVPCWLLECNIWENGAKKEQIWILTLARLCLRKKYLVIPSES